ncbi:MAG TPA: hypothetical protein VF152_13880 [Acidimicrobiia bacterium]
MSRAVSCAFALLVGVAACGGGSSDEPAARGAGEARCSAADLDPATTPDPVLPEPVARTETAIVRAAVACDDRRLDELAGDGVTVDWQTAENADEPVLATLVELFEGPVVLDGERYVWPGVEEGGPRTVIDADGTWVEYSAGGDAPAFLAATGDGRLVVLTAEGTELEELGTVAAQDASNGFAVSPDGRFAYFDRGGGLLGCETEIVRLALRNGNERPVTQGAQPAVSPDGERLAYVDCSEGTPAPDTLVVRDLESGGENRVPAPAPIMAGPSWAPDSEHVALQLPEQTQAVRVLDLADADPFASAALVAFESTDNTIWAGYRGATGEFYALTAPGGEAGAGSPLPVIAISADDGRTLGTLFSLDSFCCAIQLSTDIPGTTVLAANTTAGLEIWHSNEAGNPPQPIASDIRRAAWIP